MPFLHFLCLQNDFSYSVTRFLTRSGQPGYSQTVSFHDIHYYDGGKRKWQDDYKGGHYIRIQMEVFGCKNYDLDQTPCPSGWTAGKSACYKAVEGKDANGTTSNINFDDAVTTCNRFGHLSDKNLAKFF